MTWEEACCCCCCCCSCSECHFKFRGYLNGTRCRFPMLCVLFADGFPAPERCLFCRAVFVAPWTGASHSVCEAKRGPSNVCVAVSNSANGGGGGRVVRVRPREAEQSWHKLSVHRNRLTLNHSTEPFLISFTASVSPFLQITERSGIFRWKKLIWDQI